MSILHTDRRTDKHIKITVRNLTITRQISSGEKKKRRFLTVDFFSCIASIVLPLECNKALQDQTDDPDSSRPVTQYYHFVSFAEQLLPFLI